jgi:hypothetical protein
MLNIYEDAKKVKEEWDKAQVRWGEMIDKLQAKLMEGGFLDEIIYDGMDIVPIPTNHSKFDNIVMKEKKTKKITKAEAFEYLKGKRVACDDSNEESVQRKIFEVGIRWRGGKNDVTSVAPFLFINPNGITHCASREWFDLHEYEEISADDILSMEIVDENRSDDELVEIVELGKKIQCLLSKLSGHRHVVITEDDVTLYDEGMSLFHSDPF